MRSWQIFAVVAVLFGFVAAGLLFLTRGQPAAAGVEQTRRVGDTAITLRIDDPVIGERVIEVEARDDGGRPVALRTVRLRFTMIDMDMGTIEAEAQPAGQGRYQARGSFFSMAGHWVIDTTIERESAPSLRTAFEFPIAAPGEVAGPLNPLQSDPQTIASGQRLYAANCVPCHGQDGRGDGPSATGLNPRPADFVQHMPPGLHTDGQVFLWIKEGYPGQGTMPAWGERLNDEQIWQLVTYLRTLGQGAVAANSAYPGPGAYPAPQGAVPTPIPAVPTPAKIETKQEALPPLVFARGGNIWSSAGDSSPAKRLTTVELQSYNQYPTFSPDGAMVAFVTISQAPVTATVPLPSAALRVMNADGSGLRTLWGPPEGLLGAPAWARDGTAIYVPANSVSGSGTERNIGILRVDLASGAQQRVIEQALDPAISPDGTQIAYIRLAPDGLTQHLEVAGIDGSNPRQVIDGTPFQGFYAPRFSPDGRQIVVAAIGGPQTNSQGVPVQGRRTTPLEHLLGLFEPPAAEAHGLPWDLWRVNTDGSDLRRLTQVYEDLPMASFSPDGRQLVFMGASGIYLMNTDGSSLRRIDPVGDHGGLDWKK
jgi:Tol biopolymer transport system component/mono/diheme cytochrome c family protein